MELKAILIIIGVLVCVFVLKSCVAKNTAKNENHAVTRELPKEKIANDKIILIQNAGLDDIKKAIQEFCNHYNQNTNLALPLLSVISSNRFIVTFPYDIDFQTYCFFVNYLYYPNGISYKPVIKAWTTTKPNDPMIHDDLVNQKVMLYIPDDDREYDNVYLTTASNIGYKMGFAIGESGIKLNVPKLDYTQPVNDDMEHAPETIQFK